MDARALVPVVDEDLDVVKQELAEPESPRPERGEFAPPALERAGGR